MEFLELLDELGIKYKIEGKNTRIGWAQADCPWCGGVDYLGIARNGIAVNCWRCGKHRRVDLISQAKGIPISQAKALIKEVNPTFTYDYVKRSGKLILPEGIVGLWSGHKRYLSQRGFSPSKIVQMWEIQGIAFAKHLQWRIFIPIHYQGEVVSWTTRSIGDVEARYISAGLDQESMPHKDILYGADYCRNTVVVHEGPFDVWATGPGAVCTFGTGYSDAQVLALTNYQVRYIAFDDEPAAQKQASELCDKLSVYDGETYLVKTGFKDSASAKKRDVDKLRALLERSLV